ncbi:MAG: cysteine peptidase family C39 domain-containing protein, partial [Candidatus Omnitrophota bacterium]
MEEEIKQQNKPRFKTWIRVIALLVVVIFVPEQAAWAMGYDPSVLWAPRFYFGSGQAGYVANFVAENVHRSLNFLANKPLGRVEIAPNLIVDTQWFKEPITLTLTDELEADASSWWISPYPYYEQISPPVRKGTEATLKGIIKALEFAVSYGKLEQEVERSNAPARDLIRFLNRGLEFVGNFPLGGPMSTEISRQYRDSIYFTPPLIKGIYRWLRDPATQIDNYCGVYALHNLLKHNNIEISIEELALRVILVDLLSGNIKQLKGKLKTSLFAIHKVADSLGLKTLPVKTELVKLIDSSTNQHLPFIAHLNSDHFIYVTRIAEEGVYYQEKGEEEFIPKILLITEFSGYLLVENEFSGIAKIDKNQTKDIWGGYTYPKTSFQKQREELNANKPGWGSGIPIISRLQWEMAYPRTHRMGNSINEFTYGDVANVALIVGTAFIGGGAFLRLGQLGRMGVTTGRSVAALNTTVNLARTALVWGTTYTAANLALANVMHYQATGKWLPAEAVGQLTLNSMATGMMMAFGFKGLGLLSRGVGLGLGSSRLASFASSYPRLFAGLKWGTFGGTVGVARGYMNNQYRGIPYSWKQAGVDFGVGFGLGFAGGAAFRSIPKFGPALAGHSGTLAKIGTSALVGGTINFAGGRLTPVLNVPDPNNPGTTRTYLSPFSLPEEYNLGWQGDLFNFGMGAVFGGATALYSPAGSRAAQGISNAGTTSSSRAANAANLSKWARVKEIAKLSYRAPNRILTRIGLAEAKLFGGSATALGRFALQHPLKTAFMTYYGLSIPYAAWDAASIKPPEPVDDFNGDGKIDNEDLLAEFDANEDGVITIDEYYRPSLISAVGKNIFAAGGRQFLKLTLSLSPHLRPLKEQVQSMDMIETSTVLGSANMLGPFSIAPSYAFGLTKFYLASPGLAVNVINPETWQEFGALLTGIGDIAQGGQGGEVLPASLAEWSYLVGSVVGAGQGLKDVGAGLRASTAKYTQPNAQALGISKFKLGFGKGLHFAGGVLESTPTFLYLNTALSIGIPLLTTKGDFSSMGRVARKLAYNFDSVASTAIAFNAAFRALTPATKLIGNTAPVRGLRNFVTNHTRLAKGIGVGLMGTGGTMYYFGAHHDSLSGTRTGNILANAGLLVFSAGGFLTMGGTLSGLNKYYANISKNAGTFTRLAAKTKSFAPYWTGGTLGVAAAGAGWYGMKKLVIDSLLLGGKTYVIGDNGLRKATYDELSRPTIFGNNQLRHYILKRELTAEEAKAINESIAEQLVRRPEGVLEFKDGDSVKYGLFEGELDGAGNLVPINTMPTPELPIIGRLPAGEWTSVLINGALIMAVANTIRVANKAYRGPDLKPSQPVLQEMLKKAKLPWDKAATVAQGMSNQFYKAPLRSVLAAQKVPLTIAGVGGGILLVNNLTDIVPSEFKTAVNYLGGAMAVLGAGKATLGVGAKYISPNTFASIYKPIATTATYAAHTGSTLFFVIPALHGVVEGTSLIFNKYVLPASTNSIERSFFRSTFAAFWDDTMVKKQFGDGEKWVELSKVKYLDEQGNFKWGNVPIRAYNAGLFGVETEGAKIGELKQPSMLKLFNRGPGSFLGAIQTHSWTFALILGVGHAPLTAMLGNIGWANFGRKFRAVGQGLEHTFSFGLGGLLMPKSAAGAVNRGTKEVFNRGFNLVMKGTTEEVIIEQAIEVASAPAFAILGSFIGPEWSRGISEIFQEVASPNAVGGASRFSASQEFYHAILGDGAEISGVGLPSDLAHFKGKKRADFESNPSLLKDLAGSLSQGSKIGVRQNGTTVMFEVENAQEWSNTLNIQARRYELGQQLHSNQVSLSVLGQVASVGSYIDSTAARYALADTLQANEISYLSHLKTAGVITLRPTNGVGNPVSLKIADLQLPLSERLAFDAELRQDVRKYLTNNLDITNTLQRRFGDNVIICSVKGQSNTLAPQQVVNFIQSAQRQTVGWRGPEGKGLEIIAVKGMTNAGFASGYAFGNQIFVDFEEWNSNPSLETENMNPVVRHEIKELARVNRFGRRMEGKSGKQMGPTEAYTRVIQSPQAVQLFELAHELAPPAASGTINIQNQKPIPPADITIPSIRSSPSISSASSPLNLSPSIIAASDGPVYSRDLKLALENARLLKAPPLLVNQEIINRPEAAIRVIPERLPTQDIILDSPKGNLVSKVKGLKQGLVDILRSSGPVTPLGATFDSPLDILEKELGRVGLELSLAKADYINTPSEELGLKQQSLLQDIEFLTGAIAYQRALAKYGSAPAAKEKIIEKINTELASTDEQIEKIKNISLDNILGGLEHLRGSAKASYERALAKSKKQALKPLEQKREGLQERLKDLNRGRFDLKRILLGRDEINLRQEIYKDYISQGKERAPQFSELSGILAETGLDRASLGIEGWEDITSFTENQYAKVFSTEEVTIKDFDLSNFPDPIREQLRQRIQNRYNNADLPIANVQQIKSQGGHLVIVQDKVTPLADKLKIPDQFEPAESAKDILTDKVGSRIHQQWQQDFFAENGQTAQRWEVVADSSWRQEITAKLNLQPGQQKGNVRMSQDGSVEIDIARASFEELAPRWQADNKAGAIDAINVLTQANAKGISLNELSTAFKDALKQTEAGKKLDSSFAKGSI